MTITDVEPTTEQLLSYVLWRDPELEAVERAWAAVLETNREPLDGRLRRLGVPNEVLRHIGAEHLARAGAGVAIDATERSDAVLLTAIGAASVATAAPPWLLQLDMEGDVGPFGLDLEGHSVDGLVGVEWTGREIVMTGNVTTHRAGTIVEGVRCHWRSPIGDLLPAVSRNGSLTMAALDDASTTSLRRCLRLLDRVRPTMKEWIADNVVLYPIELTNTPGQSARESFSVLEAQGGVWLSIDHPLSALDLLVHECTHLRLGRAEQIEPTATDNQSVCLAPWHAGRRPASYVVHGLAVFTVIVDLFIELFEQFPPSDPGRQRLVVWSACLERGASELARSTNCLSPFGARLVEAALDSAARCRQRFADDFGRFDAWARTEIDQFLLASAAGEDVTPWYLR